MTWDELFSKFVGSRRPAENTVRAYRRNLRFFLEFSQAGPLEVTAALLRRFYAEQKSQVSVATAGERMKTVLLLLRWAVRQDYLAFDPGADIRVPKPRRPIPRILSVEEVDRLLAAPRMLSRSEFVAARDTALLETLYGSGLRVCEVVALDLAHVDLADHTLQLMTSKGAPRFVPYGESVAAALAGYFELRRQRAQTLENAFFVSLHGYRMNGGLITTMVQRYAKPLGIAGATPHALRRAFATHMLENGANIVELKALLGHEDLESTQHYAKVLPSGMVRSYRKSHPRARRVKEKRDDDV